MAKLQDKFFNRVIEGDLELGENENIQVIKAVENASALKVFENITDKNGHKRFIEADGESASITGFLSSYCKMSLSGTHLMLVLAGAFENGAEVPATTFANFTIPKWVGDKIYPVFSTNRIEVKKVDLYADDWSLESDSPYLVLTKTSDTLLSLINVNTAFNTTKARSFRIQFDLLIDNEAED